MKLYIVILAVLLFGKAEAQTSVEYQNDTTFHDGYVSITKKKIETRTTVLPEQKIMLDQSTRGLAFPAFTIGEFLKDSSRATTYTKTRHGFSLLHGWFSRTGRLYWKTSTTLAYTDSTIPTSITLQFILVSIAAVLWDLLTLWVFSLAVVMNNNVLPSFLAVLLFAMVIFIETAVFGLWPCAGNKVGLQVWDELCAPIVLPLVIGTAVFFLRRMFINIRRKRLVPLQTVH